MGPFRQCCGYYCAFIMFLGLFFWAIMLALEYSHNQYLMNKLHPFEETTYNGVNTSSLNYTTYYEANLEHASEKTNSCWLALGVIVLLN